MATPPANLPPRLPWTLPDIFFLVLLCDRHVSAIRFQFVLKNPPESIVLDAESVIQHRGDVILSVGVGQRTVSATPLPPWGHGWDTEWNHQ